MLHGIYVINLDRRPDRYMVLQKQIRKSDLREVPLHRVSAVDSSAADYTHLLSAVASKELASLKQTGMRHHHSQLSQGAIGCYLSHYEVWKTVAARPNSRDDDIVLVLEDDATIPAKGVEKIHARLETLKATGVDLSASTGLPWLVFWELICLEGCEPETPGAPLEPEAFWSTQAYSLSVGSARRLLELSFFPLDVQIDTKLQELRDEGVLKIYALPFFKNNGFDTDIQVPTVKGASLRRQYSEMRINLKDVVKHDLEFETLKSNTDKQEITKLYAEPGGILILSSEAVASPVSAVAMSFILLMLFLSIFICVFCFSGRKNVL